MNVNAALLSLILQTDGTTKAILCLFLLLSIMCWAILFYKRRLLLVKIRDLKLAQQLVSKSYALSDLLAKATLLQGTFPGEMLAHYLSELKTALTMSGNYKPLLADREWQLLQTNLQHSIDDALSKEEAYIPVLSTTAACATLIGLFGTVWGLIHAFIGIGIKKSADIASVAPGIAEALITTLGGLLVAIPALVMFNYLQVTFKSFEQQLMIFAEKSIASMKYVASIEHPDLLAEKQPQAAKTVGIQ